MNDAAHGAHVAHEGGAPGQIAMTKSARRSAKAVYTSRLFWTLLSVAIAVPVYYLGVRTYWVPNDVPSYEQLWMLPPATCLIGLITLLYWTLSAATADSDDLGIGKDAVSWLATISCGGTLLTVLILAVISAKQGLNLYKLNWFIGLSLAFYTGTMIAFQWTASWIRRLVNRRFFGGSQPGVDA